MIAYHGTTARRARRILLEGFRPRKPSRRVWFAESRAYALGRARTQARRAHDSPVVLTCSIDVPLFRQKLGGRRVFHKGRVIAIDAAVPVTVLRSHPFVVDQPTSPHELAAWVNEVLDVKPYKGVGPRHPGIQRLSRWMVNRLSTRPNRSVRAVEILEKARRWLPDVFEGFVVDPKTLKSSRTVERVHLHVEPPKHEPDPREEQALESLEDPRPERRMRGLRLLRELGDPDLFEWCALLLDDESVHVRVAALHTMLHCDAGEPDVIRPLAADEDKRVRGAALAALGKHGGEEAAGWIRHGLKDPSPCVRAECARVLSDFDPVGNRPLFELALHDPNREIARQAQRLVVGKGYPPVTCRPGRY
jgi:hypothetical protein